ncbi:hypothetical protein [Chitinophaga sp.]|uniref:hypothetical protein n=1 Tax=Chitinophaga sp. TaxID=1869181 RepID=UPI0031E344D1
MKPDLTPIERELLHALLLMKDATESLKGKPEDYMRLGRAQHAAQIAVDKVLKPENKQP